MMKKVIISFCLFPLSFSFTYSQSEEDTAYMSNLENVFKVHVLKIRYEAVQSLYMEFEKKRKFPKYSDYLNSYFVLIRGFSLYSEKQSDSLSSINHGELLEVEWLSEEELNRYIEHLNCTPKEALKEYIDFIQNIKLEKEIYSKCINEEISKGDLSEYTKDIILTYDFHPPMSSLLGTSITKLDFLKVFKEFVINNDEVILPDFLRVKAYLKCGCKIP